MTDIEEFLKAALQASILCAPRDHGLTYDEIVEATGRAGYKRGETADAVNRLQIPRYLGEPRIRLEKLTPMSLTADFNNPMEPEFRDINAFEFVRRELQDLAAEVGEGAAHLSRDVLVERGVAHGLAREALEVAITVTVLDQILEEKDGTIRHAPNRLRWVLPSVQASKSSGRLFTLKSKWLATAYPIVLDIVGRRTDGRSSTANPLDTFETRLAALGYERFRAWWVQKRNELRMLDPSLQPVAATVLAAALSEASLSFVVPRAKSSGLMKSIEIDKPRSWKFVDLVKGAKSSDPNISPILDERAAQRCLDLNDARQRIHAGFLIDAPQTGPIPDLKPEQARDALQTTDLLVRKILEWLDARPVP